MWSATLHATRKVMVGPTDTVTTLHGPTWWVTACQPDLHKRGYVFTPTSWESCYLSLKVCALFPKLNLVFSALCTHRSCAKVVQPHIRGSLDITKGCTVLLWVFHSGLGSGTHTLGTSLLVVCSLLLWLDFSLVFWVFCCLVVSACAAVLLPWLATSCIQTYSNY